MAALKPHANYCENCGAHVTAAPAPAPTPAPYYQQQQQPYAAPNWQMPPRRPVYNQAWFWVLIAVIALFVLPFVFGFARGFAQGWRESAAGPNFDWDFDFPEDDWWDFDFGGDYFLAGYGFFFSAEEFDTVNPDITGDASLTAADLLGVWTCERDESWQYIFAPDGTGFRGGGSTFMTEIVVEFEWTLTDGILSMCASPFECGGLEGCDLPEFWAVHIVDGVMTITSQQIEGREFSYRRAG